MQDKFKFDDKAKSLAQELKQKLDPNINRQLKNDFVLIPKKKNIYYGQVNEHNQKQGIGTLYFDNGFVYWGMFEMDQMSGLGISTDFKMNKYIGKHQDNKRNGFGTFELKDGRKYEGFWRDNRLHGKCEETLENGHQYLVYFNNGKKQDLLALDPMANKISPAKDTQT